MVVSPAMTATSAVLSFLLIIPLAALFKRRRPTTPFPPSLLRLPIFGNFFQIPKQITWKAYASWSRKLNSDLISVWVFGQHTIIINSKKAAQDLLEQRSAIYSDKLQTTMISLTGWDFFIAFLPYADKWRAHRRVFQRFFRESAISEYQPLQKTNAESLLRALYAQPRDITATVRTNIAALTMNLVYGYDIIPRDPIVDCLDAASSMIGNALFPGAMIVDALPALRYLPEWLPGMYFTRYARKCHSLVDQMIHAPMAFVRRRVADGTAKSSLISSMMGDNDANGEAFASEIGAAIYTAMADTTSIAVTSAIVALVSHPKVERRGQDELDSVIGRDRLPTFDDRHKLPYINAICREVLRWKPPFPLGVLRVATQDDVYEGKLIPKGCLLFANSWAMLHDPEDYPEPAAFNPDRFLTKGVLNDDEVLAGFGHGRRVCPGRHAAMSTLFISVAYLLAVFNIRPKKNEKGNDIPINVTYSGGASSRPSSFACSFQPRDGKAKAMLEKIADNILGSHNDNGC